MAWESVLFTRPPSKISPCREGALQWMQLFGQALMTAMEN